MECLKKSNTRINTKLQNIQKQNRLQKLTEYKTNK